MGDVNHEPSMEEILASIKRIIAEDGEGAPPATRRGRDRRAAAMPPMPAAPDVDHDGDDGVLELTNRIDPEVPAGAEAGVADAAMPQPEEPAPRVPDESATRSDEKADMTNESATVRRPMLEATEPPLVSQPTREASRQSLAALSAMIVKPDPNGPETLEGLVRDMLRPMLKEWLDAKLPGLVEQVVQREIAKIVEQRD